MRANAFRLTAFALCLLFARAAAAQEPAAAAAEDDRWENGITEPWRFGSDRYTEAEAEAARALWERVGGGGGGEWAGDYVIDMSVRAHFVRWSPKGFVFFNVNTCTATVTALDYGEVVADTPSHVEVVSKRGRGAAEARKYVKVLWGRQRHLIEEYAVPSFCDYVAGLGHHNGPNLAAGDESLFLSHREDGDKPTALLPTVPPEYARHVRRPVDARVTRVGKPYVEVVPDNEWWDESVTPVRISAGSDQGLKRGMTLYALDSDLSNEQVEVTRVGRDYALGIVVRSARKRPGVPVNEWDDGRDEPNLPVAVGWRLTTSLHRLLQRAGEPGAAREAGKR